MKRVDEKSIFQNAPKHLPQSPSDVLINAASYNKSQSAFDRLSQNHGFPSMFQYHKTQNEPQDLRNVISTKVNINIILPHFYRPMLPFSGHSPSVISQEHLQPFCHPSILSLNGYLQKTTVVETVGFMMRVSKPSKEILIDILLGN